MTFDQWLDRQMTVIENACAAMQRYGGTESVAFFVPATATEHGYIVIGDGMATPQGATDVIRFPSPSGLMCRFGFVPRQHLRAGLRDACFRLPVFPRGA